MPFASTLLTFTCSVSPINKRARPAQSGRSHIRRVPKLGVCWLGCRPNRIVRLGLSIFEMRVSMAAIHVRAAKNFRSWKFRNSISFFFLRQRRNKLASLGARTPSTRRSELVPQHHLHVPRIVPLSSDLPGRSDCCGNPRRPYPPASDSARRTGYS
jgi:hypothetical protein